MMTGTTIRIFYVPHPANPVVCRESVDAFMEALAGREMSGSGQMMTPDGDRDLEFNFSSDEQAEADRAMELFEAFDTYTAKASPPEFNFRVTREDE